MLTGHLKQSELAAYESFQGRSLANLLTSDQIRSESLFERSRCCDRQGAYSSDDHKGLQVADSSRCITTGRGLWLPRAKTFYVY